MELPNNQKAMHTRGSAPEKIAWRRALYIAQEADGEPGKGSMNFIFELAGPSPSRAAKLEVLLGLG